MRNLFVKKLKELMNDKEFILNAPLQKKDIDNFEEKYATTLPAILKSFFLHFNGGEIVNSQTEIATINTGNNFKEGILYLDYSFNNKFIELNLPKNYLVIASTNFGNLFLFNVNNDSIYSLDHDGLVDFYSKNIIDWILEEID